MTLRLALVRRSAPDAGAEVLKHLRAIVLAAVPELAERLMQAQHVELVDVVREVPGPKRVLMRACRKGEIVGAVKVGRRWLAPRSSVDAWLQSIGPRALPDPEEGDDELDELRRSLARPEPRRGRGRRNLRGVG